MPSVIGSSALKSVSNSNQLVPYRKNPFQHVNHQARFEDDPCGTNLLCWTWLGTTRQENFAVHKMAGIQMLTVVLELVKYKSARCCQVHECTHISTRLECNDICNLKLRTKILTNLPWKTFSITNFKAEELWYCFYQTPNILNMPHSTSSLN